MQGILNFNKASIDDITTMSDLYCSKLVYPARARAHDTIIFSRHIEEHWLSALWYALLDYLYDARLCSCFWASFLDRAYWVVKYFYIHVTLPPRRKVTTLLYRRSRWRRHMLAIPSRWHMTMFIWWDFDLLSRIKYNARHVGIARDISWESEWQCDIGLQPKALERCFLYRDISVRRLHYELCDYSCHTFISRLWMKQLHANTARKLSHISQLKISWSHS